MDVAAWIWSPADILDEAEGGNAGAGDATADVKCCGSTSRDSTSKEAKWAEGQREEKTQLTTRTRGRSQ